MIRLATDEEFERHNSQYGFAERMLESLKRRFSVVGDDMFAKGAPLKDEPLLEAGEVSLLPALVSLCLYDRRERDQLGFPKLIIGIGLGDRKATSVYMDSEGNIPAGHVLGRAVAFARKAASELSAEMMLPFQDKTLLSPPL